MGAPSTLASGARAPLAHQQPCASRVGLPAAALGGGACETVARDEAKALAPPVWKWAQGGEGRGKVSYREALARAVRCPDPHVRVRGRWLLRRLAPDSSRIELGELPKERDEIRLLHAMGWETANVHLGCRNARAVGADVRRRGWNWLYEAARHMAGAVTRDWKSWCA